MPSRRQYDMRMCNYHDYYKKKHTQQQKLQIEKNQRRAARYVSNRNHNTSSVTDMMSDLNWAPLEVRCIRYSSYSFTKSYTMHHL